MVKMLFLESKQNDASIKMMHKISKKLELDKKFNSTYVQAIIIFYFVDEVKELKELCLPFLFISVFPGTPAAPGMPCQGEDSKYLIVSIIICIIFHYYLNFSFELI